MSMPVPKVAVVTPTIRKDGLEIVRRSLKAQTFKDFIWLIGSPFDPEIPEATWVKDDFTGGFWSLNRIYNRLFNAAKSPLIITLQDWIFIPPDGIQKFVDVYEKYGYDVVVTGVGDQYENINKWGKPQIKIWADPRKTTIYGSFYEVNFNDIEFNYAALPKKLINQVGGADDQLDFIGFGADLFQMADRMNDLGAHFFIDQDNESYTLRHGREYKNWNADHVLFTGEYDNRKTELIKQGRWPCLPNKNIV